MDFRLQPHEERLRTEVCDCLSAELGTDHDSDPSTDAARLHAGPRVRAEARREGLARYQLAGRVRRRRAADPRTVHRREGDRSPRRQRQRRAYALHHRPDDHRRRQRGPETPLPAGHGPRRYYGLSRLLRARSRLRLRVARDTRGSGRRRLHHQRTQDVDQRRRIERVLLAGCAHRWRRHEARGNQRFHGSYGNARRRGPPDRQPAR